MYLIRFSKQAVKDKKKLKQAGLDKNAKQVLKQIQENPWAPPRENLKGNLQGYISKRINIKHRIVYRIVPGQVAYNSVVYEGTVVIEAMWSHYGNM